MHVPFAGVAESFDNDTPTGHELLGALHRLWHLGLPAIIYWVSTASRDAGM